MGPDDLHSWRGLLRTGAWAAYAGVGLILVQMTVFALAPPPATTAGHFALLLENPLLGLLSLDLVYVVSNVLALLLYLALAVVLWPVSRSAVTVAIALAALGMAAYTASPRGVEMLSLAQRYADAGPDERTALVATGDGMLASWMGTAFDIYYVLNGVALVVLAVLLLRSPLVGRATGVWAMAAAVLMAVPSNLGTVGLVFAVASLVPWAVFSVLIARTLGALSRDAPVTTGATLAVG